MPSRPELKLDWCSHEAAKYAVEHWHYSRTMPKSKLAKMGAWEDEKFIGALIFGVGSNNQMARSVGLRQTECCELVRVALRRHVHPVSRMIRVGLLLLERSYPGLRAVVSYADPGHGHAGGIYQAGNWIYLGPTDPVDYYEDQTGALNHWRDARRMQARGVPLRRIYLPGKHKYVMPLDDEMRQRILPLAKPYPKRERSADSGAAGDQPAGGSANLTRSLDEANLLARSV